MPLNTPNYIYLLSTSQGDNVARADIITRNYAEHVARQFAKYRGTRSTSSSHKDDIVSTVPLTWFEAIGISDINNYDPVRVWNQNDPTDSNLRIPLGPKVDSDFNPTGELAYLNLAESSVAPDASGPHITLQGQTGSGKSILIKNIVATYCYYLPPSKINFILIDFKGGSTFLGFERFPHVVGKVSNLANAAEQLSRLNEVVEGELNRRQTLFDKWAVKDIIKYREKKEKNPDLGMPPLPDLFVLTDEFGQLVANQDEFIALGATIGRIGRSLGVHYFPASQEVNLSNVGEAFNRITTKVSLSVEKESHSREFMEVPDAARLPNGTGVGIVSHKGQDGKNIYTTFKGYFTEEKYIPSKGQKTITQKGNKIVTSDGKELISLFGLNNKIPVTENTNMVSSSHIEKEEGVEYETMEEVLLQKVATIDPSPYQIHQLWQKPLSEPFTFKDLGIAEQKDGPSASIGVIDNPYEHNLKQLNLTLGARTPHYLVAGGPGAGKTTTLVTTIISYALNIPGQISVFVLDWTTGGTLLNTAKEMPHVAGYSTRQNEDMIERIFGELTNVLHHREKQFADNEYTSFDDYLQRREPNADDPYSHIIFAIDGIDKIFEEYNELEGTDNLLNSIEEIMTHGAEVGIHVICTNGSRQNRFVMRNFSSQNILPLSGSGDVSSDYSGGIHRKINSIPTNIPGYTIVGIDDAYYNARVAAPWAEIEDVPPEKIQDGVEYYSANYDFRESTMNIIKNNLAPTVKEYPSKIKTIPDIISYEVLQNVIEKMGSPTPILGAGFSTGTTKGILLPPNKQHCIVTGEPGSGKTNFLRTQISNIVTQYSPEEAKIFVIDPKWSLLGEKEYLIDRGYMPSSGYATNSDDAVNLLKKVIPTLKKRFPTDLGQLKAEQIRAKSWWSGPEIFVIIDDISTVVDSYPDEVWGELINLIAQDPGIGLHIMMSILDSEYDKQYMGRGLLAGLIAQNTPILALSSSQPRRGVLPYGELFKKYRAGKGKLINPESGEVFIIQTPLSEPWS